MTRTIRVRDGALEISDDGPSPSLLVRTPHERCAIDLCRDELRALRWAIDELLYTHQDGRRESQPLDRTWASVFARCVPLLPLECVRREN